MNKLATGLIAGTVIGAIGLSYAMQDKKTRRRVMRDGRRAMNKASDVMDNITEIF